MDLYLDTLLNLPNVTVKQCQMIDEGICLNLGLLNSGVNCPHCHQYSEEINQTRFILVRDLPIVGRPLYLKVPRRQFTCQNCQGYFTETLNYFHSKRRHTFR